MAEDSTLTIPMPAVAPTGFEIDKAEAIHPVWEMVMAEQGGRVQSIEDRMLMAVLRAVHEGLNRRQLCTACAAKTEEATHG